MKFLFQFLCFISSVAITKQAQSQMNTVTYLGGDGKEVFYDVMQLSDGTILASGYCEALDWIAPNVNLVELNYDGQIPNALGSNRFGILCHFSSDLAELIDVVHFPQGAVEDIRFIKSTNIPYQETGALYISSNTEDTYNNDGGYIIAKLNGNFIDEIPSALEWYKVVWALSYAKESHPWDVTGEGEVYYVSGQAHGYDWSAMYCLDANGERRPVENWRTHWLSNGQEWKGTPAQNNPLGSIDDVNYSGIVFKAWGRCELRSWNQEDFDFISENGNGGQQKGKWPADFLFNGPCDVNNPNTDGPGYNGYAMESCCPVFGASSVVVDRRNGDVYLGMNFKSYATAEDSPDFEPAVLAFDHTGTLRWWSRLYHEINPNGEIMNSLPDQYVDALAIDYTHNLLVVAARAHGNNTENLWEGDEIASNPNANGFQNRFTGTNGNIHESWLGKLSLEFGELAHSTYVAEYAEATDNFGAPHVNQNLDGWPDPNQGWPNVNTTRIAKNNIKVSSSGDVIIGAVGRRTITTANAYQKMVLPYYGGLSCWNSFVRQYESDLSLPKYSSLVVGVWDTLTQIGGANTDIYGVYKTNLGILAVGRHIADDQTGIAQGEDIPTVNVPAWGSSQSNGESAILVYYQDPLIYNQDDLLNVSTVNERKEENFSFTMYPNPARGQVQIKSEKWGDLIVYDVLGNVLFIEKINSSFYNLNTQKWAKGVYFLRMGNHSEKLVIE